MSDRASAASMAVTLLLMAGLLLIGASFTMLDRGWLATAPVLGVRHPVAAGVGVGGILLCLASIAIRRASPPLSGVHD